MKVVCSGTLRWNGYGQDHDSGGDADIVIQLGGTDTDRNIPREAT